MRLPMRSLRKVTQEARASRPTSRSQAVNSKPADLVPLGPAKFTETVYAPGAARVGGLPDRWSQPTVSEYECPGFRSRLMRY